MSEEEKVNVYDGDGEVIARVRFTRNLDSWDGHNWGCGGTGNHEGLTKLKDGRYIIVYSSQFEGNRPYGEIVSKERALHAIMVTDNLDLLDEKRFEELKQMYEEKYSDQEER